MRTDGPERVPPGLSRLPRAVGGALVEPGEDLFVPAVSGDQLGEPVASRPPAFVALDPQHDELAEEVRKDDRAVAGHCHRFDAWQPRSRRCGAEKCHSTPHGPDNSCGPAT